MPAVADVPPPAESPSERPAPAGSAAAAAATLEDVERQHIIDTLERANWTVEGELGAAAALGLNASTLRSRMKKLGIARPRS